MYNLRDEATHGKKELQIFKNNKRERLCFIYDVGNGARKYDTANGERSLKNLRKKNNYGRNHKYSTRCCNHVKTTSPNLLISL